MNDSVARFPHFNQVTAFVEGKLKKQLIKEKVEYYLTDIVVVRSANAVIYDPRVKKIISRFKKKIFGNSIRMG